MKKFKGQASFEFLASVIFLAIILVAIFYAFYTKIFEAGLTGEQQSLSLLCSSIAEKINSAEYYGTGFEYSITLPAKIGTKIYSVNASSSSIVCSMGSFSRVQTLTAKNLTNGISGPPFLIAPGLRAIKNSGTAVVIS